MARLRENLLIRFWSKVRKSSYCWEWTAYKDKNGYGHFWLADLNASVPAHRVSWLLFGKTIKKAEMILHKCDNPPCVRPDHLFAGTALENTRDMWSKGRWKKPSHLNSRRGDDHPNSKLTYKIVAKIKSLYVPRKRGGRFSTCIS